MFNFHFWLGLGYLGVQNHHKLMCIVCFITFTDIFKANLFFGKFYKNLVDPTPGWDKIQTFFPKKIELGTPNIAQKHICPYTSEMKNHLRIQTVQWYKNL